MIFLIKTWNLAELSGFESAVVTLDEATIDTIRTAREHLRMLKKEGLDLLCMELIHTGEVKYYDDPLMFGEADDPEDVLTEEQEATFEQREPLFLTPEEKERILAKEKPSETDRDLLIIEADHFYWRSEVTSSLKTTHLVETEGILYDVLVPKEPEKP